MKLILQPQKPLFTLKVGGLEIKDLVQVSEWEGFLKLVVDGQTLIVMDERGRLETAFDSLMAKMAEKQDFAFMLVAGSPDILARIREAAADHE